MQHEHTPTPAQIAKARAIAGQVTAPCYDDTCDGRGCDRHTAITAIAAALADEAQQVRRDVGEQWYAQVSKLRERVADAEQRGRQAGLREAAER